VVENGFLIHVYLIAAWNRDRILFSEFKGKIGRSQENVSGWFRSYSKECSIPESVQDIEIGTDVIAEQLADAGIGSF
jgi:hypothetical protein